MECTLVSADSAALRAARRHVQEFENIVARQERIVRSLSRANASTDQARRLLETMRYSLELARDHVERLEQEAAHR